MMEKKQLRIYFFRSIKTSLKERTKVGFSKQIERNFRSTNTHFVKEQKKEIFQLKKLENIISGV